MSGIWVPNTSINGDANHTPFVLKETSSDSIMDQIGNAQSLSSSNAQNFNIYSLLTQCLVEQDSLKKDIDLLKKKQEKQDELIKSIRKLSDITQVVIVVLCIIPIIQVVVCGVLIHILGMQDKLNGLLNFSLTCLLGISITELFVGFLKVYGLDKRINVLEKMIDKK